LEHETNDDTSLRVIRFVFRRLTVAASRRPRRALSFAPTFFSVSPCLGGEEFRDDDVRLKPDATLPIALSGALVCADVFLCALCASVAKSFVMVTSG